MWAGIPRKLCNYLCMGSFTITNNIKNLVNVHVKYSKMILYHYSDTMYLPMFTKGMCSTSNMKLNAIERFSIFWAFMRGFLWYLNNTKTLAYCINITINTQEDIIEKKISNLYAYTILYIAHNDFGIYT